MKNDPKNPLTITITGICTIAGDAWEKLMILLIAGRISETPPPARNLKVPGSNR